VPATVHRGDLTIAIATEGRCPALAGMLREELEARYGPEYAELVSLFGEARKKMIELGWDGQRIRKTLAGMYRAGDRRLLDEFLTRRACGESSSSGTSS
jgi:precorrin-2 dehydrogenase/sirohydrochlorin ferrochelatase